MLTEQHQVVNRYLLTQGCVSHSQLIDEYKSISETYPGTIRTRNNKTPIQQIIADINNFMSFMNASIETYNYELNNTTYHAYQLAIGHNNNNDLITKHSINLKQNEIKFFRKLLDLSLLNHGLISQQAIYSLNEKLSIECTNDNDIINDNKVQQLITFFCEKQYLYKLLPQQNDEKDEKEQSQNAENTENSYCIGPRSCIGLTNYIQNTKKLSKCANCKAIVVGYGFKCPYKCRNGIYHEKCIQEIKECIKCEKAWKFNPVDRVGLLSDPAMAQDLIDELFNGNDDGKINVDNDDNHNRNNNENDDEEDDGEDEVVRNGNRNRKRNRDNDSDVESETDTETQSQSQVIAKKRRRTVIQDDSDED